MANPPHPGPLTTCTVRCSGQGKLSGSVKNAISDRLRALSSTKVSQGWLKRPRFSPAMENH